MKKKQDEGFILVTALLLLLVLTIVGISAVNTSTVENMLSGNIRLKETNFSMADAGVELSAAIIEQVASDQNTQGFAKIITDNNFDTELRSKTFDPDTDDISFTANNKTVDIDIDKMYVKYMGGSSVEFASGYEGVGKGASSGFYSYYRINSSGSGLASSETQVGSIYRYVPK